MQTPTMTITSEDVVIRIPRRMVSWFARSKKTAQSRRAISFDYLMGALEDVPEYKGKTSVEVQHMMRDLWIKKPIS